MLAERTLRRALRTPVLLCGAALAAGSSWGQAHEHTAAGYTVRASTVRAQELPQRSLQTHGIASTPDTAVLNVTVQRGSGKALTNVRADVKAEARNLVGVVTPVPMREITENGLVSYLGVYQFLPNEVLDFRVSARPVGVDHTLELRFRDRLRTR